MSQGRVHLYGPGGCDRPITLHSRTLAISIVDNLFFKSAVYPEHNWHQHAFDTQQWRSIQTDPDPLPNIPPQISIG